ncbi:hypothetical protein [Streptomyces sp. NPDC048191]|uniref:hypothetical protein n=1 Tax=Streptomyces sp. NPDC048191 TaxID=3155484 RepID=UPI0033DDCF64
MNDVTAQPSDKPVQAPDAETGRPNAPRRRDRGVRTCVPAVLDRGATSQQGAGSEDNIVRGED